MSGTKNDTKSVEFTIHGVIGKPNRSYTQVYVTTASNRQISYLLGDKDCLHVRYARGLLNRAMEFIADASQEGHFVRDSYGRLIATRRSAAELLKAELEKAMQEVLLKELKKTKKPAKVKKEKKPVNGPDLLAAEKWRKFNTEAVRKYEWRVGRCSMPDCSFWYIADFRLAVGEDRLGSRGCIAAFWKDSEYQRAHSIAASSAGVSFNRSGGGFRWDTEGEARAVRDEINEQAQPVQPAVPTRELLASKSEYYALCSLAGREPTPCTGITSPLALAVAAHIVNKTALTTTTQHLLYQHLVFYSETRRRLHEVIQSLGDTGGSGLKTFCPEG